MNQKIKKIAVFTSGGDAPGMNAAIRAVVRTALHYKLEVVGIKCGYQGMIDGDFVALNSASVSNIIQTGGTILHSARCKEFRTKRGRKKAAANLKAQGIDAIVAIGGDGTFSGASVFIKEHKIPVVGLPGTIDNDLYGTDFTIGYDTAINTAMNAIDNIKDTAHAHNRLFFVEVMGRDVGFIALRSGIATGAESVLIPESKTDTKQLISTLSKLSKKKNTSCIVVVSEGDEAGGAFKIAEKVGKKFKDFDIRVSILGHLQRGGRPTAMERVRATRMGMEAVKALLKGKKGVMIGQVHNKIKYTPFEKACKHNRDLNPVLLEMVNILS